MKTFFIYFKTNFVAIFLTVFLFSLFFPVRYVFYTNSAYLTGVYSDFTSLSLYLSDILIFIAFFIVLWCNVNNFKEKAVFPLLIYVFIFWLILQTLYHLTNYNAINWYFFFKYAELLVSCGTVYLVIRNNAIDVSNNLKTSFIQQFIKIFLFFCSVQSFLALWQFSTQSSIGLYKLGESHLAPYQTGIATIVSGGTKLIRGYGTFPHPNVLSAFLVCGVLFSLYLWGKTEYFKHKVFYFSSFLTNLIGLTLSFSRSAYLAILVGLSILLIGYYFSKRNVFWKALILTLGSIIFCVISFYPLLVSRATLSDNASLARKEYNRIGLVMIKNNPIFGVGMGESVLHMEQYSGGKLEPWQKQPIHNYFLLSAAELGMPGALILIWIFLSFLKSVFYNLKTKLSPWPLALSTILLSFFALMMFDHYFYTIQSTQMLLWIILGLIASTKINEFNKNT